MMNTETRKSRITETSIGGTVYIVEALQSDTAKETAYAKVKRLILNNADGPIDTFIIRIRLDFCKIVR